MSEIRQAKVVLDPIDRRIINALQGDFPLCDEPYRAVAETLGLSEAELLARLQAMLDHRVLTRFGPMFQVERMGGAFVLAALAAPEERYDEVTLQVNALPEIDFSLSQQQVRRRKAIASQRSYWHRWAWFGAQIAPNLPHEIGPHTGA